LKDLTPGKVWDVAGGDVVSSAPELARLTLNVAMVHHDAGDSTAGRLVYGGHTIGLAATQATRALPNLVTIVGWHSCDHLAPVREGDTLRSSIELERIEALASGGGLVHLRSRVRAVSPGGAQDVLDWRFIGVMA
jgi:acyl dehydratase